LNIPNLNYGIFPQLNLVFQCEQLGMGAKLKMATAKDAQKDAVGGAFGKG
jgi:hypothetical protein